MMDLIVRNCALRNREGLYDVCISNGLIEAVRESGASCSGAGEVVDAEGCLLTEAFCNAHMHLCKVYTVRMLDSKAIEGYHGSDMGAAMTAIELAARVKENYREDWILENVRRCLKRAVENGNLYIRAFADVDSKARLEGVKALLKAREEFKDLIELQVSPFPQDGVVREPGTVELVEKSMEMGCDVVGGIPWIEFTEEDERVHIDEMMRIAKKYGKDVSMLVDDAGDPDLRTLEMLAVSAIRNGWQGRCLAHHARAMSMYRTPYFKKVSALLKMAGMGIVSDPHTGPLHAKVKELLAEGNLVCLGQDDVADAYYPFGQCSMLEVGFLNTHLLWMTTFPEMEVIYDMITRNAAKCMNVEGYGVEEGCKANLVVLREKSVYEALWYHEKPKFVIAKGRVVR